MEKTQNPRTTKTQKLIQPTCWILHFIVVGVNPRTLPRVCCAWLCRSLAVALQTLLPEHPLPLPQSFPICVPFLLRTTSTVFVVLFVLSSFHKHSHAPGFLPFCLLLPLVAIGPCHLYSSPIYMPQFALPSSLDASAKKLNLSTCLDNSNANMPQ